MSVPTPVYIQEHTNEYKVTQYNLWCSAIKTLPMKGNLHIGISKQKNSWNTHDGTDTVCVICSEP
jgi:hypothetical protein